MARSQQEKQTIIFVKSPNESNYEQDEYTRRFSETNLYLPIFISILKTKFDDNQINELKEIIKQGPGKLGLDGVVITSSRSVDSIQLALNKIQDELDDQNHSQQQEEIVQEIQGSTWSSIPFFLIGTSTYNNLLNLNNFGNSNIFPNPKIDKINILGHHQSGSGFKLAEFIKSYFSDLKNDIQNTPERHSQLESSGHNLLENIEEGNGSEINAIRLLYLTGDPRDSGLSENLLKHNSDSKHNTKFNLIEKIVYSVEPETQPRFEPQNIFNSSSSIHLNQEIQQEEQYRLEKEIQEELNDIQKHQQLHLHDTVEERDEKLVNWIIFFSPNSTRILLNNVNNLLVQIKARFIKLNSNQEPDYNDDQIQLQSSTSSKIILNGNQKLNEYSFFGNLLHLNLIKIGVIGPTTSNFITKKFLFSPTLVSPNPNPSSLLKSILDFDHPSSVTN